MMKSTTIAFLMQILGTSLLVECAELGDIIPLCAANDPNLNECAKKSAQELIPKITKGVPIFKIPPLDPMVSPEIKLHEDDDNIQIDISYTDVTQTGLSKTQVDNAVIDLKNGLMIFNFTFPILSFVGQYKADGHILKFKMTGEGKSNITIENAKSDLAINFHVDDDHIKEDNVAFDYNFDKTFLDFDHVLFQGDEELGKTAATFINENGVEIMNGFKPSLDRYYGNLLRNYLKGFFEAVPYSSLFKGV